MPKPIFLQIQMHRMTLDIFPLTKENPLLLHKQLKLFQMADSRIMLIESPIFNKFTDVYHKRWNCLLQTFN